MGTAEGGSEAEKRKPGRHRSYFMSQSGQAVCVWQETETECFPDLADNSHTHTHTFAQYTHMHMRVCTHVDT